MQEAAATPSSLEAPKTVSDLIGRSQSSLGEKIRSFTLVESSEDQIVRTGRVTVYPVASRPTLDLVWSLEGGKTQGRSDGNTVFVKDPSGDVRFSPWDETGSTLYSQAAGKLLGVALDASSFASYGASLTESDAHDERMRMEASLPSGGGWSLEISTETWLPEIVTFRATPEAEIEQLVLELVPNSESRPIANLRLEPDEGREARLFYAGPGPGDVAPDVTFELSDGSSVSLVDLRGSVVVVDFWATWCVPCRPAMKTLEELYQANHAAGLEVFGLRLFDYGDPTPFLSRLGISYPIGDGNPFVEPYAVGTYGLPTLYVIDRQGKIAKLIVGFSGGSESAIRNAIESALKS